ESEVGAVVDKVTQRTMTTAEGRLDIRDVSMTMTGSTGVVPLEIWVDSHNRLARLTFPAASVVVIRDDLASVLTREVRTPHKGDEDLFIPANGFTLGATIT